MSDSDSRVRYYACESLYNVTKVTRENIMGVFNEIFVAMTIVITDLVRYYFCFCILIVLFVESCQISLEASRILQMLDLVSLAYFAAESSKV